VFAVDCDASIGGDCKLGPDVRSLLQPLVQYANASVLVGGLNSTTPGVGNGTVSTAPVPIASMTGIASSDGMRISVAGAKLIVGLVVMMPKAI
jgi:5'-nucleotidase